MGRFISPDTIVPGPGDPQSLNRYAYVRNNPLRFKDPTGMFSEDEIMNYYGVKTWDEVLTLYEKGGRLEGLWGWLETLRLAKLGDSVKLWTPKCTDPRCGGSEGGIEEFISGVFAEQEGQLVVLGGTPGGRAVTFSANAIGMLSRSAGYIHTPALFTRSQEKYTHFRYDPARVDWVGVGLGVAGLGQDAGMPIALAGAATVDPVLLLAGISMVGLGTASEAASVARTYDHYLHGKASSLDLTVAVGSSVLGLMPGVGFAFSLTGIAYDLGKGVQLTP